jgi:hypothetical protein
MLSFCETIRTLPAVPSTSITCPSLMTAVAVPVPTTVGMPYSRATTAPLSVTSVAVRANRGVHDGRVDSVTRISPGFSFPASDTSRTTLTVPCAMLGEPGNPISSCGFLSDTEGLSSPRLSAKPVKSNHRTGTWAALRHCSIIRFQICNLRSHCRFGKEIRAVRRESQKR